MNYNYRIGTYETFWGGLSRFVVVVGYLVIGGIIGLIMGATCVYEYMQTMPMQFEVQQ